MKPLLLLCIAFLLLSGCCSMQKKNNGNDPIVSPTVISDESADTTEPQFPAYTPWWKSN